MFFLYKLNVFSDNTNFVGREDSADKISMTTNIICWLRSIICRHKSFFTDEIFVGKDVNADKK